MSKRRNMAMECKSQRHPSNVIFELKCVDVCYSLPSMRCSTWIISHALSRSPPLLDPSHTIFISGKCSFYSQMKSSLNARNQASTPTEPNENRTKSCDGKWGSHIVSRWLLSRHIEMVAFVTHSCAQARLTESENNSGVCRNENVGIDFRFPIVRACFAYNFSIHLRYI